MGYKDRAKVRAKVVASSDKFKLKEDENFIRVLPTPESEEGAEDDVFTEIYMHQNLGPEGKGFVRCGKDAIERTEGECWICDKYIPRLVAQGNGESAKRIKASWSLGLQVLALVDNKWTGPHPWQVGGKLGKALFTLLGQGTRDYASATKGYTLSIIRTGTDINTTYSSPIPDEEPSKIPQKYVDMLKPFNQLTEIATYSEQAQKDAVHGNRDRAAAPASPSSRRGAMDDDDEPVAKPAAKKRAVVEDDEEEVPVVRTKVKVSAPVDDDDEDEPVVTKKSKVQVSAKAARAVEPEDEDEDEEPAPKSTKKQAAIKFEEPEEEAAEDEADEDEEPVVVKTKKKAPAVEPEDDDDEDAPPVKATKATKPTPEPVKATKGKAAAEPAKGKAKAKAVEPEDEDDDPFGDDED